MSYVVLYQDEGPNGPCGQSAHITNPWTILKIFYDREELREFAEKVAQNKGRRRPKLTWITKIDVHKDGETHFFGEDNGTPLPLDL